MDCYLADVFGAALRVFELGSILAKRWISHAITNTLKYSLYVVTLSILRKKVICVTDVRVSLTERPSRLQ